MQGHPTRRLVASSGNKTFSGATAKSIGPGIAKPWPAILDLLLGFEGRLSRSGFCIAALTLAAIVYLTLECAAGLPGMLGGFVTGIAYSKALYPAAALTAKRLQDRDKGIAYVYLFLGIPVLISIINMLTADLRNPLVIALSALYLTIVLWALIELLMLPGSRGTNRFDPRAKLRPSA